MRAMPMLFSMLFSFPLYAGDAVPDWQSYLSAGKYAEARPICEAAAKSDNLKASAEGYKCLANLALQGKDLIYLQGSETGGGVLRSSYGKEPTDVALAFLGKALEKQPDDLSIHQGRMHLLLVSSRYEDTPKALDDSMERLSGKPPAGLWVAYSSYFWDDRVFTPGVAFLERLATYYPDNYEIIGNLGAFHVQLGNLEKALTYSRQALALHPNSTLDAANIARINFYLEDWPAADMAYQHAIELGKAEGWQSVPPGIQCTYANMLIEQMNQPERACALDLSSCQEPIAACEK